MANTDPFKGGLINLGADINETAARYKSSEAVGLNIPDTVDYPFHKLLAKNIIVKYLNLAIIPGNKKDMSFLKLFTDVEGFGTRDKLDSPIDLLWFPKLKGLTYYDNFLNIEKTSIVEACMMDCRSKTRDLTDLPAPATVEKLGLVSTNITSLNGIEKYKNLKSLMLNGAKSLTDLSALAHLSKLEYLQFSYVPQIDLASLPTLPLVTGFYLEKGKIPSLHFLEKLPAVHDFYTNAVIENNDLTPFAGRNWTRLTFKNKKTYNGKLEDFIKN